MSTTSLSERIPVSAYIRTLNAERCLRNVLQGIVDLVDEILIVDSGSTDQTRSIAKEFGAKIIDQPWLGWGHQKRVGEDAARNDWLLDIDADEVVTPELARNIRQLFRSGAPSCPVYLIRHTQVFPSGRVYRHAGVRYRAKLYDRRAIRIPAHTAWDQFKVPRHLKARKLPGPLLHYGFSDMGSLVRKQESALNRLLQDIPKTDKRTISLKIFTIFPIMFLKKYFQQGLWRAGVEGFSYSMVSAFGAWLKHVKLYERDWITPHVLVTDQTAHERDDYYRGKKAA